MTRARVGIAGFGTLVMVFLAAIGALRFTRPLPHVNPFPPVVASALWASPSLNAFGASHGVKVRTTLPGSTVDFPVEVSGDPAALSYAWVPLNDSVSRDDPRPLDGSNFVAPGQPGLYRLAVFNGADRYIVPQSTLAVMVPFGEKIGSMLNGYRIGIYLAERLRGNHEKPPGFVEVRQADVGLPVSSHLKLGDFLTHDQADVWPKYVALNPRLLDKVELVLAKLGARAGARLESADGDPPDVAFDVHSGFRTPYYNRHVPRAARDSRHEYGDAVDLAIDADGDGRVTVKDELLVARAVDEVEQEHPELVGGLGIYTSRRYRTPYVHIDVRGKRTRWRG